LDKKALSGLIGLSRKARHLEIGEDRCLMMIRDGRASLVLIDEAISENGKKRYTNACTFYNVSLESLPANFLSSALGKTRCMAAAFVPNHLTDKIKAVLQTEMS